MAESWAIRRGRVLRRSEGSWMLERADVEIVGGRIHAVDVNTQDRELGPDDLDASRRIVVPGLVNGHLHSNDDFLRGRVDKLPLEVYMLTAVPVTGVREISAEDLETRTLLGAAEALRSGTTFLLDDVHHIDGLRPEAIEAIMGAYERIGLRAWVTAALSDLPMPDTVPYAKEELSGDAYAEIAGDGYPTEEVLEYCEDSIERHNDERSLVRFAMSASGPQRCSDELLQRIHEVGERYDVPVATHALETRVQALAGELFYGKTLIEHMDNLGFLAPRTVLIHGVWVTDEDLDMIASSGASIVHNPTSNLRLGSGVAPVAKMLERGINVALGTDGISCNDAQNVFLEMRLAGCLHNVKGLHFEDWIGAQEAFTMGSLGGAKALRMGGQLGEVEAGFLADLTLLDADSHAYVPLNEPVQNIVFSEHGQSVRTVVVNGEIVVHEGQLARLDQTELAERGREAATRFFSDNADAFDRLPEFVPAFRRAYDRAFGDSAFRRDRWLGGE